jgi:small-conductance mechanosensitive channel
VRSAAAGGEGAEQDLADARSVFLAGLALSRAAVIAAAAAGVLLAWGNSAAQVKKILTSQPLLSWVETDVEHPVKITASDVATSFVVFVIAILFGRLARGLAMRRLGRASGLDRGTRNAIGNLLFALIAAIGGYVALGSLHVNVEAVKWLAGSLGIGVGFGLQNIVNNYVSGVILLIEKPIRTDDVVDVGGVTGRVDQIGTRSTVVVDDDNIARIIPNSEFVSAQVTNWSYGDPRTRIHCPVGVEYGSDAALVKKTLLGVAAAHPRVLRDRPQAVNLLEFGGSAMQFELVCYVLDPMHASGVQSDLNFAIYDAFARAGIGLAGVSTNVSLAVKSPVQIVGDGPRASARKDA